MYIVPITKIHSTFAEAKKSYEDYDGIFFDDETQLSISDLSQGKRNIIVGEPGIGKTMLLNKIRDFLEEEGISTALFGLRQHNSTEEIDRFVKLNGSGAKAL